MFAFFLALWVSALVMSANPSEPVVRIATFNIWELSKDKLDAVDDKGRGTNIQLRKAAEVIQRVRPAILLVNEIDFDADQRRNAAAFRDRYLKVSQNGQEPIDFPHIFFEPVNTGVPTGLDLDNDGKPDGPGDAFGFGKYPGQYGMAIYSRYPLEADGARMFQKLLWKDMPGNLMPDGREGRPAWYSPDEVAVLRLSSKSHWDVPVRIGDKVLHLLASHPTPPVFDGPEDRNGRRAFDEIRLWADYLSGGNAAAYIKDDKGRPGGLPSDAAFVILGDQNADAEKDSRNYGPAAIEQLLKHPRVQDPAPTGTEGRKTCDFGRIDYVLPSRGLAVRGSGVFWPPPGDPLRALVDKPDPSSDHRLVWVDIVLERAESAASQP